MRLPTTMTGQKMQQGEFFGAGVVPRTVVRSILAALLISVAAVQWPILPVAADAPANAAVVISEVVASNDSVTDDDGDTPDWIELWNRSDQSVSLAGWELADSDSVWVLPAVTLGAGEYLIVWASDKDRNSPAAPLHTDFKLSAGGEFLVLRDAAGVAATTFAPEYPKLSKDESWAIGPDGTYGYAVTATPGQANSALRLDQLSTPQVAVGSGFVDGVFTETITNVPDGAQVRYTLDGTSVTSQSLAAVGNTITVPANSEVTQVRVALFAPGFAQSDELIEYYLRSDLAMDPLGYTAENVAMVESMPVVVLDMPNDIWEARQAGAAEYFASQLAYIDPDGAGSGFSVGAGAKLFGNISLGHTGTNRSFRIKFDDTWGDESLEYPLFDQVPGSPIRPVDEFDFLELHGSSIDTPLFGGNYIANPHMRQLMLELGTLSTHGQFVNLFYNGQFRGLYQLRERFDDNHFAAYQGGSPSDYEHLRFDGGSGGAGIGVPVKLLDGSGDAYSNAYNQYSPEWWDAEGIADSILSLWHFNQKGEDEWRFVGPSTAEHPGGVIMMHNDLDISLTERYISPGLNPGFENFFENFSKIPEFREIMRAKAAEALCGDGPMTDAAMVARLDGFADIVLTAVPPSEAPDTNIEWLRDNMASNMEKFRADLSRRGLFDGCDGPPVPVIGDELLSTVGEAVDVAVYDNQAASYAASGLPPGLSIDSAVGTITGAATTAGDYSVTVTATRGGSSLSATFAWTVVDAVVAAEDAVAEVIINEFNSVSSAGWAGDDPAFVDDPTNGGDWIELLVTATTDLRGYSVDLYDRDNFYSTLEATDSFVFADHPALAAVQAGTIVTISQRLPDDADAGGFHINANASNDQPGELLVERSNFDTNATDLHVIVRNADGKAVGATAGETATWTSANGDLTDQSVIALCAALEPGVNAAAGLEITQQSTFGEPNNCGAGNIQDLADLRGRPGDVNCSGSSDLLDALVLARYLAGGMASATCPLTNPVNQIDLTNADYNNDGTITAADVTLILRCNTGNNEAACR